MVSVNAETLSRSFLDYAIGVEDKAGKTYPASEKLPKMALQLETRWRDLQNAFVRQDFKEIPKLSSLIAGYAISKVRHDIWDYRKLYYSQRSGAISGEGPTLRIDGQEITLSCFETGVEGSDQPTLILVNVSPENSDRYEARIIFDGEDAEGYKEVVALHFNYELDKGKMSLEFELKFTPESVGIMTQRLKICDEEGGSGTVSIESTLTLDLIPTQDS